jgi:hypothetical protein
MSQVHPITPTFDQSAFSSIIANIDTREVASDLDLTQLEHVNLDDMDDAASAVSLIC